MTKMPKIVEELATLINRMPVVQSNPAVWKRLRIALTPDEVRDYVKYVESNGADQFVYALRGVPIQVESAPDEPSIAILPIRLVETR